MITIFFTYHLSLSIYIITFAEQWNDQDFEEGWEMIKKYGLDVLNSALTEFILSNNCKSDQSQCGKKQPFGRTGIHPKCEISCNDLC